VSEEKSSSSEQNHPVVRAGSLPPFSLQSSQMSKKEEENTHHVHVPLLDLFGPSSSSTTTTSMGADFKCGMTWSEFIRMQDSWKKIYAMQVSHQQQATSSTTTKGDLAVLPFLWTVSGGEQYSVYLPMILKRWQRLGMYPTLVMALDLYTADLVCRLEENDNVHGMRYFAILWDQPKLSYSRVSDVKFELPATLVDAGIPSLFIEPDIFCRRSPIPIFLQEIAYNSTDDQVLGFQPNNDMFHNHQSFDLIHTGAHPQNWYPNIGAYLVLPNPQVATFFRNIRAILAYSTNGKRYSTTLHGKEKVRFFDQAVYHVCLPQRKYERGERLYYQMYQNKTDFDLVQLCQRNVTSFRYKAISHEIMGYAPKITENTHCIHPLMGQPGQAFETKLLIARYYGFEPDIDVWDGTEQYIHFYGGDLTTSACFDRATPHNKISSNSETDVNVFRFQYQLSTLITLAIRTNRTVVLPRHVRTREGDAVQLPILVSILSIEKLVKYRFDIPRPLLDAGDGMPRHLVQSVFMAQDHFTFHDTLKAIQDEATHLHSTVIAVDRACLLVKEEDYKIAMASKNATDMIMEQNNVTKYEVLQVMSQINWCIGKRNITFYQGTHGPHDKFCENFYIVKTPGVTW